MPSSLLHLSSWFNPVCPSNCDCYVFRDSVRFPGLKHGEMRAWECPCFRLPNGAFERRLCWEDPGRPFRGTGSYPLPYGEAMYIEGKVK